MESVTNVTEAVTCFFLNWEVTQMIPDDVLMRIEMLAKYKKACEASGIDLKELLLR